MEKKAFSGSSRSFPHYPGTLTPCVNIQSKTGKNRKNREEAELFAAVSKLRNAGEVERFLRDLATPAELAAFSERWRIARLLNETDMSYRDIAAATGASTTTVGRVARFLSQEPHQGYRMMLNRLGTE